MLSRCTKGMVDIHTASSLMINSALALLFYPKTTERILWCAQRSSMGVLFVLFIDHYCIVTTFLPSPDVLMMMVPLVNKRLLLLLSFNGR